MYNFNAPINTYFDSEGVCIIEERGTQNNDFIETASRPLSEIDLDHIVERVSEKLIKIVERHINPA